MACGILHNICRAHNLPPLGDDDDDDDHDSHDDSDLNYYAENDDNIITQPLQGFKRLL